MYIHYGSTKFDKRCFRKIQNNQDGWTSKPKKYTGLWASPITAKINWYNWCIENLIKIKNDESIWWQDSLTRCFIFIINKNANVVHITKRKDLNQLPLRLADSNPWVAIDFEKCIEEQIDAIELHLSQNKKLNQTLYGWDCDCILIINPNIVHNIKLEKYVDWDIRCINNTFGHVYKIIEEDD